MTDAMAPDSWRTADRGVVRALCWLSMVLALVTLAWLVRGLGRGLELTDESFYLLSALHADSIRLFFTPTHWVSGALWQASQSLTVFRALGLLLALSSAMVLAWGCLRVAPLAGMPVPPGRLGRAAVLATAASGAMLYGSLLNFTPSYNLLGAGWACLAMGLGLLSMAGSTSARSRALALFSGTALGLAVLCKFSTGISTGALLLVLHLLLTRQRAGLVNAALMTGGAFATVAAAVYIHTGPAEALRQFHAGVAVVWVAQGDKSTLGRITRSAMDMLGMVSGAAIAFWGPLLCFAVGAVWRPMLLGCIGAAWMAWLLVTGDHLDAGMSHYTVQALPLAALLAFALVANWRHWALHFKGVLLVLALAALPLAIAIGTWNPLQIQILTALAPWGVLVGLLGFAGRALPGVLVSLLFGLTVLMQVIGNGAQPYRMRPLTEQSQAVVLPQLGTVLVDEPTAAMVRDIGLAAQRCAIAPGAPFLDFYNLPGVALVLGAVPIDWPWLLDPVFAGMVLKEANPATLRRAVVAVKLDSRGERPKPPPQLGAFPQGFRLCGRATAPVDGLPIELWAPVN